MFTNLNLTKSQQEILIKSLKELKKSVNRCLDEGEMDPDGRVININYLFDNVIKTVKLKGSFRHHKDQHTESFQDE